MSTTNNFTNFLASIENSLVKAKEIDMNAWTTSQETGIKNTSNEVSAFVKRFLVMKSFHNASVCCLPTTTYVSTKSLTIMLNALAYYSQYGLINSCQFTMDKSGVVKLNFALDENNISNGYRRYLNDEFGLHIPFIEKDDKLKEIDNNLLSAINSYDEIDLRAAGVY